MHYRGGNDTVTDNCPTPSHDGVLYSHLPHWWTSAICEFGILQTDMSAGLFYL